MTYNYAYSFEKLKVWQKACDFVVQIYTISHKFPAEEKYGLTNQLRRSAISISANIAEGSSRASLKDQAHFSQLAYSSLMETISHLYIAERLDYISSDKMHLIKADALEISNLLNSLRSYQVKRHRSDQQINKSTNQQRT